ncbi:MAG: hypothetical protein H7199_12940 [Burkholderiales bacterium]|nr:hypothetical protein [Flavobacterium sp.]
MLVMGGFEATTQIYASAKYPQQFISIRMVTASVFDENKIITIFSGMDDFVNKPVNLKNLEEVIAKHILVKSTLN